MGIMLSALAVFLLFILFTGMISKNVNMELIAEVKRGDYDE